MKELHVVDDDGAIHPSHLSLVAPVVLAGPDHATETVQGTKSAGNL